VDILLGTQVQRICVENGRATGVVAGGKEYAARSVLSNANIKETVLKMIDGSDLPADFTGRAEKIRLSRSSSQVYIGIRKGEVIDDVGDLLFTSTAEEFDSELLCSRPATSRTFSFYYPKTRPGHEQYTIVASMNARYEDWSGLNRNDYEAAKREMITSTIESLEHYVPGVREKIDYTEAATPLTFRRYTGHWGGASFGSKFEGLEISTELPKVLKGVFHTGSTAIIMSGWLGAANYGVIVAHDVEEYLEDL
jgi:phytoene dehydrogenase-like protein